MWSDTAVTSPREGSWPAPTEGTSLFLDRENAGVVDIGGGWGIAFKLEP